MPSLIIHARGDRVCAIGNGRYLAESIPGARLCEIDSEDHLCHFTQVDQVLDEIEEFGYDDDRPGRSKASFLLGTVVTAAALGAAGFLLARSPAPGEEPIQVDPDIVVSDLAPSLHPVPTNDLRGSVGS